jgi:hypothetical protein
MLKKIFRWFLIALGLLGLLLGVAIFALSVYLDSRQEKLLEDFSFASGLDVAFRRVDIKAWQTFPRMMIIVDSLVVRDASRPVAEPALLDVQRLTGQLSLGNLLFDTLRLENFTLRDGRAYFLADSTGRFNLGRFGRADKTAAIADTNRLRFFDPQLTWDGVEVRLTNFETTYQKPSRNKDMRVRFDSLFTTAEKNDDGQLCFLAEVNTYVHGLAFNTDKGYFLKDTRLAGHLEITRQTDRWVLEPTLLTIAGQPFNFEADILRAPAKGLRMCIENGRADYDRIRQLLPDELAGVLGNYSVSAPYVARVNIVSTLLPNEEPLVELAFRLAGQDVRVNQFNFGEVHGRGTFVNQLPEAEGGIPGSKKNYRIVMDSTRGYYAGMFITTPGAILRGTSKDVILTGPMAVNGPASALNEQLGNTNFFFRHGRFELRTHVDASLNDIEAIITSSDGQLQLQHVDVDYRPASVRFPFRSIDLDKQGEDISFRIKSGPLSTGFAFGLDGRIDNLLPLLLDRPADSMRTDVVLSAPRIGWTDFLAIFGTGGYLADSDTRTTPLAEAQRKQSMKKTLLGLQATFRPRVEARFDTVAYFDVLQLDNFVTGLRFDRDTLVLEQTSFKWEGSDVAFDARLHLGQDNATPFRLAVSTDHLNLNRLRPSLNYFGLRLPAGLDSLPEDLNLRFAHRGVINDTFGIQPGCNLGRLAFNDGRENLFAGTICYAPKNGELQTKLRLTGAPRVVNHLFGAKDYFFSQGRFSIDLDVVGTPADLGELVENAYLSLRIDSSRVAYRTGGVVIPVQHFRVDASNDHVDYDLQLFSKAKRRALTISGTVDRLTAFLYPEAGHVFRMTADASAENLSWSDLKDFLVFDAPDTATLADTTTFDSAKLLATTGGIFNSFQPTLSLKVDTFWTDDVNHLTDIQAGFHLRDDTRMVLEQSGFRLGQGSVLVSASYDLDQQQRSPFHAAIDTDSLSIGKVLVALAGLQLPGLDSLGHAQGTLSIKGNLRGQLDETRQQILLDSTTGRLSVRLTDLELADWPQLQVMGRKLKMAKRLDTLRFAPLLGEVTIDSGRVSIPRTEIQSTALQLFVEGSFDTLTGPDLLIAVPLKNIGRGVLSQSPAPTGYARAGWKVYLVVQPGADGKTETKFRLGRRRYFRERGLLEVFRELRHTEKAARRQARKKDRQK